MKIVSIVSGKGGVLKTTTSCNLSAALALKGKKVLVIDIDKQSHTTKHFFRYDPEKPSIVDVMIDYINPENVIQDTDIANLYIIPASFTALQQAPQKIELDLNGNRLDRLLPIKNLTGFDYVIIDCPPDLELLTRNALYISDYVLIPLTGDRWGVEGFSLITDLIADIQRRHNPKLRIGGVFLVKDDDSQSNRKAKAAYKVSFKELFFDTTIRNSSKMAAKASYSLPLVFAYPKSLVSVDYFNFTEEFLRRCK